jgi:glycerol uptake facilitator-like aquaporin
MELPGVAAAAAAAPDRIPQPAPRGQESATASALTDLASRDLQNARRMRQLDEQLDERIKRDKSDRARIGRRRLFIRALWGEFFCTLLFFTPIFGVVANARVGGYDDGISALVIAATGGFQAIANIFAFSSVSGAHFNPAISFALWLTGKLSNRKLAGYIFVQLLASIMAMCIVAAMFYSKEMKEIYAAVVVQPPVKSVSLGKVFATEFFLTFILTYVAFTVVFEDAEARKKETMSIKGISDSVGLTLYASTPQSKTGFAPFSIGLTVFSLSLIGGSSGGAFNPARLFGPAIFSGVWTNVWLYWLAEFAGSACAGVMVHTVHGYGLQNLDDKEEETGLGALLKDLGRRSEMPPINPLISSITEV